MSTFWTPGGERPVNPTPGDNAEAGEPRDPAGFQSEAEAPEVAGDPSADMEELRRQLLAAPANLVIANHCFGIFELAALHLSSSPPKLSEAQLAIDALAAIVESLTGRLGEAEPQLTEGLKQLRLAFVEIRQAAGNAES